MPELLLKWMLRLGGCVLLTAALAAMMPLDWMESTHRRLGFGPFPHSPVAEYLARSASALYAMRGALMVLASLDVRRYSILVLFLGVSGGLFGLAILLIDLKAGMPLWWMLAEGPPVLLLNIAVLTLYRKMKTRNQESGVSNPED